MEFPSVVRNYGSAFSWLVLKIDQKPHRISVKVLAWEELLYVVGQKVPTVRYSTVESEEWRSSPFSKALFSPNLQGKSTDRALANQEWRQLCEGSQRRGINPGWVDRVCIPCTIKRPGKSWDLPMSVCRAESDYPWGK